MLCHSWLPNFRASHPGQSLTRPWARTRLAVEVLEERALLNNRFVVPLALAADNVTSFHTLRDALSAGGVDGGDVIQIQLGSSPGRIIDPELDNALFESGGNLTIQGEPGGAAAEIPPFVVDSALTVAQPNLTFRNVNVILVGGNLTIQAAATNAHILDSVLVNHFAVATSAGVLQLQSTGAVIAHSTLISDAGGGDLIQITPTSGSANVITGNTLASTAPGDQVLLRYSAGTLVLNDQITSNTFLGNRGDDELLNIGSGVQNVTIRGNFIQDRDPSQDNGLVVAPGVKNISILSNRFALGGADTRDIRIDGGDAGTTSVTVALNQISTNGLGTGMLLRAGTGGTFNVKVEGNDFHFDRVGVAIETSGGSVTGLDLGGGSPGSKGGNNFRGFTAAANSTAGAIVVSALIAQGPVQAQNNLFSVDPETAIFDHGDQATLADVIAANNLTGDTAFVQALYLEFLNRAGSAAELGGWVSQLNSSSVATVANLIVRSTEGLGNAVDGLFRRFLRRETDDAGRAAFVNFLQSGGTLEAAITLLVTSPEYRLLYGSDAAFVQSLYHQLLERTASNAEVSNWLATLPTLGRGGVASAILNSAEYRGLVVRHFYVQLLKRSFLPTQSEVTAWVNSGLDLLSLTVAFSGNSEFQNNG
jgi:hypothetical protein